MSVDIINWINVVGGHIGMRTALMKLWDDQDPLLMCLEGTNHTPDVLLHGATFNTAYLSSVGQLLEILLHLQTHDCHAQFLFGGL